MIKATTSRLSDVPPLPSDISNRVPGQPESSNSLQRQEFQSAIDTLRQYIAIPESLTHQDLTNQGPNNVATIDQLSREPLNNNENEVLPSPDKKNSVPDWLDESPFPEAPNTNDKPGNDPDYPYDVIRTFIRHGGGLDQTEILPEDWNKYQLYQGAEKLDVSGGYLVDGELAKLQYRDRNRDLARSK